MNILVCGDSRNEALIRSALSGFNVRPLPRLIHTSGYAGIDRVAAGIAADWGWVVEAVPIEWDQHGRRAPEIMYKNLVSGGRIDQCVCVIAKVFPDVARWAQKFRVPVDLYREEPKSPIGDAPSLF